MPNSSADLPKVVWWNWRTQQWDRRRIAGSPMAVTVNADGQPDGLWQIDWESDGTTSYTITHLPTGRQIFFYATAPLALAAIGSGAALAKMNAQQPAEVEAVAR